MTENEVIEFIGQAVIESRKALEALQSNKMRFLSTTHHLT